MKPTDSGALIYGLTVVKFDLFVSFVWGGRPDIVVLKVVLVWFIYRGGIVTLCMFCC